MATIKGGNRFVVELTKISQKAKRASLKVGFLKGSTYPDGTSVPMVALVQNFGSPKMGIPPRPFMSLAVKKNEKRWGPELAKIMKATNYNTEQALNLMGERIKGQIQQEIRDLIDPPLSPVTLMLRKMKAKNPGLQITWMVVAEARRRVKLGESVSGVSTKPLIDTGILINSVEYEVKT